MLLYGISLLPGIIPLWFSLRRAVLRCSSQIMDPSLEEQFLVPTLRVRVPRSWFKTEERAEMPDQVRHDGKGLSSRSTPILSSRSAPIRDLVLAISNERRCQIGVRYPGLSSLPIILSLTQNHVLLLSGLLSIYLLHRVLVCVRNGVSIPHR